MNSTGRGGSGVRFLHGFGDNLVDSGFARPAEAFFGIFSLSAVLVSAWGPTGLRAAGVIGAVVGVVALAVLAIASQTTFRRRQAIDRMLMSRYCEMLIDGVQSWRLLKWEQRTVVNLRGDVRQTMTASCAVRSAKLGYYRIRVGAGWNQPKKHQRQVRVWVRSLHLGDVHGAAAEVTQVWLPDGKLEVLVHFPQAISRSKRFTVAVELDWPGKCRPLMRDKVPDEFRYLASRFLEELAYTLVLPADCDATCDPIGFEVDEPNYSLNVQRNTGGQLEISLSAVEVKPPRTIGMRVDLR